MVDAMTKAKGTLGPKYDVRGGDDFHPGPNGQLLMAYAFRCRGAGRRQRARGQAHEALGSPRPDGPERLVPVNFTIRIEPKAG